MAKLLIFTDFVVTIFQKFILTSTVYFCLYSKIGFEKKRGIAFLSFSWILCGSMGKTGLVFWPNRRSPN